MVSHWNVETTSFGDPVLQVLANPAVSTLGSFNSADRPGINLSKAWDLTTSPFDQMPVADTTCPLLAMSGGFSHMAHPLTIANYLSSTAPLFIPSSEEMASTVSVVSGSPLIRAFYLPWVLNLPVGMFWQPKNLTIENMLKSIRALSISSPSPYASFIYILESLNDKLRDWLRVATCNPLQFACKVFSFDTIEAQFPSLISGSFPRGFPGYHSLLCILCPSYGHAVSVRLANLTRQDSEQHCSAGYHLLSVVLIQGQLLSPLRYLHGNQAYSRVDSKYGSSLSTSRRMAY
jgi:hypothetical protein